MKYPLLLAQNFLFTRLIILLKQYEDITFFS